MRKYLLSLSLLALLSDPALADWTGKDATGATITFKNSAVCSSVVCVPIAQLVDSAGAAFGVTGNPIFMSFGTGVTLPAYASTPTFNVGTLGGAGTAANQSSQITQETAIATALGTPTDAPCTLPATTISCTQSAVQKATANAANAAATFASQYPSGATAITASATGTTAATTATLAGTTGKTTYICSLSVRANATANTNVTDTVTGVITGTLSRALWVPANTVGLGIDEMIYTPCVPASATNTAIAVVSGAPGTGGVVTVNATGYQQ